MVSEEIISGLQHALAKGQSLQQAMQSFYNAGYEKQEILEAAKDIQMQKLEQSTQPTYQSPKTIQTQNQEKKPIQKVSNYPTSPTKVIPSTTKPQTQPTQKISNYIPNEDSTNKKSKIFVIVLLIILIILIGALIATFFFREQLIDFFTRIFNK